MRFPSDEAKQEELARRREKRIDTAIAALGTRNMNNTKWREFFAVFNNVAAAGPSRSVAARIKFVDSEQLLSLGAVWPVNDRWGDSTVGPFLYREIERWR